MLLNLHKKSWIDGLKLDEYQTHCSGNETVIKDMLDLAKNYNKVIFWHLFSLIYAVCDYCSWTSLYSDSFCIMTELSKMYS